ncbi:MAG: hypothetical protein AMXMBFR33_35480 [Candidatus Xenobia bacterium]
MRLRGGHSLLEAIVAASIFAVVALALTGVWAMYYSALGKSANTLAANHLARTVVEGALAQGYDWIVTQGSQTGLVYNLERRVRGRVADCQFSVDTVAVTNVGRSLMPMLPEEVCKFTVTVKWKDDRGNQIDPAGFNNQVTYSTWVYRGAQQ